MNKLREISTKGWNIIERFISSFEGRNLNKRTLLEYSSDIKHFIGWHEYQGLESCSNVIEFDFEQIDEAEVEKYQISMKKEAELKASTINRRLSTLKLFFTWSYSSELIDINPAKSIRLLPIAKKTTGIFDSAKEKILIDVVKNSGNSRDVAIIKLMIGTGIRVSEVCGLRVGDVHLAKNKNFIHVGEEGKVREVPLSGPCSNALSRYIHENNMYQGCEEGSILFPSERTGGMMSERGVRHMIKKYADMAMIDDFSAYDLRRSYGVKNVRTIEIEKLAKIMGYSNANTVKAFKNGL